MRAPLFSSIRYTKTFGSLLVLLLLKAWALRLEWKLNWAKARLLGLDLEGSERIVGSSKKQPVLFFVSLKGARYFFVAHFILALRFRETHPLAHPPLFPIHIRLGRFFTTRHCLIHKASEVMWRACFIHITASRLLCSKKTMPFPKTTRNLLMYWQNTKCSFTALLLVAKPFCVFGANENQIYIQQIKSAKAIGL